MEKVLEIDEWKRLVFNLVEKYQIPGVVFSSMSYGRYSDTQEHMSYSANIIAADACVAYESSWEYAIKTLEEKVIFYKELNTCPSCGQLITKK
jgi:hypothetical protein